MKFRLKLRGNKEEIIIEAEGLIDVQWHNAPVEPIPQPKPKGGISLLDATRKTLIRFNLNALGKELAEAAGVPSYAIINDKILKDLLDKLPQSLEEMREIRSLSPVKVERYGQRILDVILPHRTAMAG